MSNITPKMSTRNQSNAQRVERKALLIGFVVNVIMGIAGWYMFLQTDIDALFLDGNFSLISASGCLAAIVISRYSVTATRAFPNGMLFLEPLYASLKGLFSLGMIIIAGVSAVFKLYEFIFLGKGTILETGSLFYYAVFMTVLCFMLSGIFHFFNKKLDGQSTILTVESKASFIDGVISFGLGLAILLISLLPKEGNTLFVYYTADALITVVLIVLTIHTPIEAFKQSFVEMMNGVITKGQVKNDIETIISTSNGNFSTLEVRNINIHKMGKSLTVFIGVGIKDKTQEVMSLLKFDAELKKNISKRYTNAKINIILS